MTEETTEKPTTQKQAAAPRTPAAPKASPRPRRKLLPLIVVVLGVAAFFIW
jgi:hypothetical protein